MKSLFQKAEDVCAVKTKQLLSKYNLVESEDKYSTWDFSGRTSTIEVDDKPFFIEVKNRSVTSTAYGDPSVYIEYDKFKRLIATVDKVEKADVFYLTFFSDDVAYIHNLRKLKLTDVNVLTKNVPRYTMGESENVDKLFIELPFALATKRKVSQ